MVEIDAVHLIDEASAGLLAALAPALAASCWLVVALRRPGRGPDYGEPAVRIGLDRLTPAESTAGDAVTDANPLPPHRVEAAVARAGGNPQFLLDLVGRGRR